MRKLTFIGFVALGALIGLLSAAKDDWATRVVMIAIGALVGTAIGGGLTRMGSRKLPKQSSWLDEPHGQGTPEDELVRNYWRDRGHAPFMKPPEPLPDRHVFDPDKLD
ncbi:hypothetical protein [Rhizobacter fulvus]|jgi:hypothetical protein